MKQRRHFYIVFWHNGQMGSLGASVSVEGDELYNADIERIHELVERETGHSGLVIVNIIPTPLKLD